MRKLEALLLTAGLIILIVLLWSFGWREALAALRGAGWVIAALLFLEIGSKYLFTSALWFLIPDRRERLRKLFTLGLAADAVNYLVPTATISGHALVARHISGDLSERVALVTASGALQAGGQFFFALIGIMVMMTIPVATPTLSWAGPLMIVISLCGLALSLIVMARGIFSPAWSGLRRVWPGAPDLVKGLGEIDRHLVTMLRERPRDMIVSTLLYSCGWAWGILEVAAVLSLLGVPFSLSQAIAVEAVSVVVDGVLFFMPAKTGVQEGGKVLAFALCGLPSPAGLAFGLFRRVREMLWTAIGYGFLVRGWQEKS